MDVYTYLSFAVSPILIILGLIYLKRKYYPSLWNACYRYLINSLDIEEMYHYNNGGSFSKEIELDDFTLELHRNYLNEVMIYLYNNLDCKRLYKMEAEDFGIYHNGRISKKEFRSILKEYKIY